MGTFTARRDRSTTVELGVAQSTQRAQRKKTKRARANANRLVLFSLRSLRALRALRELLLLTFSRNDKLRDIKLRRLPSVARRASAPITSPARSRMSLTARRLRYSGV